MKTTYLILSAGLVSRAFGACPFELLKRSGALNEADLAKFESVKRDPKAAEALFQAHKREAAPDPSPAGVLGPIVSGILDLPYGGGLRKLPTPKIFQRLSLMSWGSQWRSSETHWRIASRRHTYAPASGSQKDTGR